MLSQYVTAFEVQVQGFPYNFSCGSPLEGPEVTVGDTMVSVEEQTRTKIKAVL